MLKITLLGETPSKKNSRNLFIRNGRIINIPSQRHQVWETDVLSQLKAYRGQPAGKVAVIYQFYVKDNGKRDLDNMIASVNDVLVKAHLLADDSWQCLSIGAADAEIDRANPRVEVEIEEE